MKKKFLNYSINLIKKYNPDIDNVRIDELRYGLEGFYLTITKLVVVVILALIFNIFKEMLIMLIIFNILRSSGFGLHATKSWVCLLSSCLIFIIFPFLSRIIVIPYLVKIILGIISIILMYLYAPADTKKRPIINIDRRNFYKFITTIDCIVLVFISLYTNNLLSNLILFGIYSEVVIILPITYKLFNLSYDNYKNYLGLSI